MKKALMLQKRLLVVNVFILMCTIALSIFNIKNKVKDTKELENTIEYEFDFDAVVRNTKKAYNNGIAQVFVTILDSNTEVDLYTDKSKEKVYSAIVVKDEKGKEVEYKDYGIINVRGNSTSYAAKKPYNIKFDNKVDLFGMGKAKSWSLLANTFDKSLLRNEIGLNFFRTLEKEYESGNTFTSKCKPVDLYINMKYMGTYLLAEAVEVGKDRVDIDINYLDSKGNIIKEIKEYTINDNTYKVNDALLELANDCTTNYYRYDEEAYYYKTKELKQLFAVNEPERSERTKYSNDPANSKKPEFLECIGKFLDGFENILTNKKYNDSEQYEKIKQFIDVDSFVDYYITAELFKIKDIKYSSTRFYIKDGKLYAGPLWDMDLSSGNISDNKSYKGLHAQKFKWFEHLMDNDEFCEKVKNRYDKIKPLIEELYCDSGKIDKAYRIIKKSAKCNYENAFNKFRNESGWGYDVIYGVLGFYTWEEAEKLDAKDFVLGNNEAHDNYESYVEDFKEWLENRHKWLSEEFNS